uniref:piggyBac transposable element-derived protein 4-like n=1 Tax=Styela clava TaxID=7725 RepID=UPI00193A95DD|nr:piggyBac transposable element-derived protein 4-like [Styela clava]
MPRLSDYWSGLPYLHHDFFPNAIFRNRFQAIFHTMFHCCDIEEDQRTKWDKIQPIINYVVQKFQQHFVPYQQLSADESMIGYKGRIRFRQYNPKKPIKWGLLARTLADANTGYLLNIVMYYGKDEGKEIIEGSTKTSSTIVELLQPYLGKGHNVFCDRLYTSLNLADYLHEKRTYLTGTIMQNRKGVPVEIKGKSKSLISMRSSKILLQTWTDKRPVTMISTYYRGDEIITKDVRGRDMTVNKPLVVERYILYKLSRLAKQTRDINLLSFRRDLVSDLVDIGREATQRKRRSGSASDVTTETNIFHVQKKVEPGQRRKECNLCSKGIIGICCHDLLWLTVPPIVPTAFFERPGLMRQRPEAGFGLRYSSCCLDSG